MAYNLDASFAGAPLVSIPFSADSQLPSSETKFRSVCPRCTTPTPLEQKMLCPNGHGEFSRNEVGKAHPYVAPGGKKKDAVLVPFTDDEVTEFKGELIPADQSGKVVLTAYPTEQIDASGMIPGSKRYWIGTQKDKPDTSGIAVLHHLAADTEVTWMAHVRIGQSIGIYQLEVDHHGHLTMVELVHAERLKEAPELSLAGDDTAAGLAAQILDLVGVSDFDANVYADHTGDAVAEAAAAKVEAGALTFKVEDIDDNDTSPAPAISLAAALEASLAAAPKAATKAAHPAKKAAARKKAAPRKAAARKAS